MDLKDADEVVLAHALANITRPRQFYRTACPPGPHNSPLPCIRLQKSSMIAANRARTIPYCRIPQRRSRVRGLTALALDSDSRLPSQRCVAACLAGETP